MHLTAVQPQTYVVNSGEGDTAITAMVAPYKASMDSTMNKVIGHLSVRLVKAQPEGTMGNWLTDVVVETARRHADVPVDFAISNYGGLRIDELPAGPVTLGRIFELMPFDNTIVVLDAKGEVVKTLVEYMAKAGGWPVSKELRYQIVNWHARNITIAGMPLDTAAVYHIALPDFIADGGDKCDFLVPLPRKALHLLVRDALIEKLEELERQGLSATTELDGRVSIPEQN